MGLTKFMKQGRPRVDLTGKKFGRLLVLRFSEPVGKNKASSFWCRCDCGNEKQVSAANLGGNILSCGCLRKENPGIYKHGLKHGMCGTNTYHSWRVMMGRCFNINGNSRYKHYGKVCERWLKFKNFFEDMGKAPVGTTIGRVDVKIDFCKKNCCWMNSKEQNRNKLNTIRITVDGVSRPLIDICDELELNYNTIKSRFKKGFSIEDVLYNGKLCIEPGGTSIKGYWKNLFWGSSCELLHLMDHPNLLNVQRGPSISYQWEDGSWHKYFSDYFDSFTNTIEEVKQVGHILSPLEKLKKQTGEKHAIKNGLIYNIVYKDSIPKEDIYILRKHLVISLDKKHEKQYQDWLNGIVRQKMHPIYF